MKTVEEIKAAIEAAVPGAGVEFVRNPGPAAEHSLRVAPASAVAVATFLRDDADLALDFLSNVSGVDWPDKEIAEKVKVTRTVIVARATASGPNRGVPSITPLSLSPTWRASPSARPMIALPGGRRPPDHPGDGAGPTPG